MQKLLDKLKADESEKNVPDDEDHKSLKVNLFNTGFT
jgi:hypothetical protein